MGAYVTTSRSVSPKALELGEALAAALPSSVFERRGQKTVDSVVARSRFLGKARVLLLAEKGGLISLGAIAVTARSWSWLKKSLEIKDYKLPAQKNPMECPDASFTGPKGNEYSEIFGYPPPESEDFVNAYCREDGVTISYEKKNLLELKSIVQIRD